MAHEGADVVINGRTEERVRVALAQIKKDARNVDVRNRRLISATPKVVLRS